ncbi:MAG TPA: tetratricopeptide repeat protein [Pyrinomonadaceae bacterium]|nr:tetratricopeptide repeat protein [Pyrinomonadaceae bacterium]
MNKNNFLFGIVIGLIAGLAIGFFVANSINRNSQLAASQSPTNAPFLNQQVQNASVKDQPATGGMLPDITEALDKAKNELNNFEAQMKAGDMYLRIRSFDKAEPFFDQAERLNPSRYEDIVSLGNAYFDIRKYEKAEKWYERALKQKPDDTNVRTDYGITFVERANPDLDRAVKEFQTSLAANPKHEPTLYNLAVAHFKKGNAEESNKVLTQLETVNPNSQLVGRLRQIIK